MFDIVITFNYCYDSIERSKSFSIYTKKDVRDFILEILKKYDDGDAPFLYEIKTCDIYPKTPRSKKYYHFTDFYAPHQLKTIMNLLFSYVDKSLESYAVKLH